jgi:hypothetical protein
MVVALGQHKGGCVNRLAGNGRALLQVGRRFTRICARKTHYG